MEFSKYTSIEIVAVTICAEAGGEPWAGKVMVGEAIANRAIQSGMTPRDVCLAPKQFSCWNNRGTMELRMQTMKSHPSWPNCLAIAKKICQPDYKTSTEATHYANLALCSPYWIKGMKRIAVVGRHTFYV